VEAVHSSLASVKFTSNFVEGAFSDVRKLDSIRILKKRGLELRTFVALNQGIIDGIFWGRSWIKIEKIFQEPLSFPEELISSGDEYTEDCGTFIRDRGRIGGEI